MTLPRFAWSNYEGNSGRWVELRLLTPGVPEVATVAPSVCPQEAVQDMWEVVSGLRLKGCREALFEARLATPAADPVQPAIVEV